MSFSSTSIPGQTFYYQIGSVTTTVPWTRPSFIKIKTFFEDDSVSHILEKYNVYLYGACLWNFNTWDIDLILIHDWNESTNWDIIEEDINLLNNTALNKHNLLLDISVFNNIDQYRKLPTKTELIEANKGKEESNYIYQRSGTALRIGFIKKQVGDIIEENNLDSFEKSIRLTKNYLYKTEYGAMLPDKIIQKILKLDESKPLLQYLNYKDFLSIDREFFYDMQNKVIA